MLAIYWKLQLKADLFILLNADKLNIFWVCKTKNMSEIKREQLCILTILGHVKTGVKIVKCN